jgi:DNA-binding NtrC family response regulator
MHPLSSTVRRDDAPFSSATSRTEPHLFLILESARPLAGGARLSLAETDLVTFGRGTERGVVRDGRRLDVRIPDAIASSSHAKLVRDGSGWKLEDLGSTNGTFVSGKRVERAALDGELFEIGETLFVVRNVPTPTDTRDELGDATEDRAHGLATLLPEYARSLRELRKVMASGLPLLLLGESGTGKEVLARATHHVSQRPGAFVPVNCGAIPDTLVESQLFGHVRGAFSGAVRDEPGFVRSSDRGTLFLDEVGDLPRTSQAALLRVLQEHEVVSVGSAKPVRVDLRVVSATHRPLSTLSMSDKFRHDLYARLAGYTHELLPVRARKEDLGFFVAELLRQVAPERANVRFSIDLARAFFHYDWPLNLREIHHALSAALVFAEDGKLKLRHAPAAVRAVTSPSTAPASPSPPDEEDVRLRADLESALVRHKGNVSEIARELGKTRMQIHRWMRRFGIDAESYRK